MNTIMEHHTKVFAFKPCQKARGGMSFYPLTAGGGDVQLLLRPVGSYPATVPFEPNVFGGKGGEPRKAIRFSPLGDGVIGVVQELEGKAKELLRGATKNSIIWNSAINEGTEMYPASLKANIWVSGERAASIRNQNGEPISMPGQPWPRPSANAALDVKGVYHMANGQAGLVIQVTALQLGARGASHGVHDPLEMMYTPNQERSTNLSFFWPSGQAIEPNHHR